MPYSTPIQFRSLAEYRNLFELTYCVAPLRTHDGILVRFKCADFDHCCYKSTKRDNNKDAFCPIRASRILWIADILRDPTAEMHVGWDKNTRSLAQDRRVSIGLPDYLVVIRMTGNGRASFHTAYVANDRALRLVRQGPKWPKPASA